MSSLDFGFTESIFSEKVNSWQEAATRTNLIAASKAPARLARFYSRTILSLIGGNSQLLSDLNFVGIVNGLAICVKDLHVLVGIPIELLADLRKVIASLNRVGLATLTAAAPRSRAHSATRIYTDIGGNIICIRVNQLDLIPEFAFCIFRRSDALDKKLIVLYVKILELYLLLIGGIQH